MLPKTIGPEQLSEAIHLPVATIKVYARSWPERLPPRWQLPGTKQLLWLEDEVADWMNSFSTLKPRR